RSEEHTSHLRSLIKAVCRLLLEKKHIDRPRRSRHLPDRRTHPGSTLARPRLRVRSDAIHERLATGLRRSGVLELCFFFNDTATTEIYTLSLHDALPI